MKRHIVRLSALSAVLGLGGFAIANFPRADEQPAAAAADQASENPAPETQPTEVLAQPELPGGDPFAARSRPKDNPREPAPFDEGDRQVKPIRAAEFTQERPWPNDTQPPAETLSDDRATRQEPEEYPGRQTAGEVAVDDDADGPTEAPTAAPVEARANPFRKPLAPAQTLPAEEQELQPTPAGKNWPPNDEAVPSELPVAPLGSQALPAEQPLRNSQPPPEDSGDNVSPNAQPLDQAPQSMHGGGEGTGRPGDKQLEGSQVPEITVEKLAPQEIQVGKPATFQIRVLNTGKVPAQGVEIHDEVPQGTQLVSTTPEAARGHDGRLVWALGALQPGEELSVKMELMPLEEGEIGSVATVQFRAEASVRTVATKPELALEVASPDQAMIDTNVQLSITVSNPGTGAATGVVLEERVPDGLTHPAGNELEFEIGELKPGESRQINLTLTAAKAGQIVNTLSVRGDANVHAEQQVAIEVIAPALEIGMTGPSRRYLERQATYTVSVSNPGTAPAKDVEVVTHLPKGLQFVTADNAGHYDPNTHTVSWSLEELPASESGSVSLTALPVEAGEQRLRSEGKAQQGLADEHEQMVVVEGVAAIVFEVVDAEDPIEVGGETTYEVKVSNQGSKAATNVRVVLLASDGLKVVSAEGPARHALQGNTAAFDPVPRLAPKAETTFQVRVQGAQPGDQRVRVQLTTDEQPQPVNKEENTRVYADE